MSEDVKSVRSAGRAKTKSKMLGPINLIQTQSMALGSPGVQSPRLDVNAMTDRGLLETKIQQQIGIEEEVQASKIVAPKGSENPEDCCYSDCIIA